MNGFPKPAVKEQYGPDQSGPDCIRDSASLSGEELVAAVASVTDRSDRSASQDRCAILSHADDVLGIVVCDGVGSYDASGEVAGMAARLTGRLVSRRGLDCWSHLASDIDHSLAGTNSGATTHIALAMNRNGKARFSFLGDGALIEVKMRELKPGSFRPSFTEVALSQAVLTDAGWSLAGYLPAPPGEPVSPVVGGREPAAVPSPALWLAVSDGVSADTERPLSNPDPNNNYWQQTSRVLVRVLEELSRAWPDLLDPAATDPGDRLATALFSALDQARQAGDLTDDTTATALMFRPRSGLQSKADPADVTPDPGLPERNGYPERDES